MYIRRFMFYSLIYLLIIGGFVHLFINNENYQLNIKFDLLGYAIDHTLTLPVAIWIVIPLVLLIIICIFHISFYGFKFYSFKRQIRRDENLYKELVKEIFLGLDTNKEFKTDFYKTPSQAARVLSPWKKYKDIIISDEELGGVAKLISNVQDGEVVDLKKFKLPKDNSLFIKNELNKIEKMPNYFLEILKGYSEISDELSKKANEKLIQTGSFLDIKKFGFKKSSEEIMTVINRFIKDEIDISSNDIFELLDSHVITKEQYNASAILLKDKVAPDALVKIFEKLKAGHQDAEEAYIYVLFELQMIDQVRDILDNSDPYEHQNFKLLLYLRENGRIVPATMLFR